MGIIDLQEDTYRLAQIRRKLKCRGLRIDLADEWEVHGPHDDMNYQVYVGYAYYEKVPKDKRRPDGTWVAIYPQSVYEIEDSDHWSDVSPEQRIFCLTPAKS